MDNKGITVSQINAEMKNNGGFIGDKPADWDNIKKKVMDNKEMEGNKTETKKNIIYSILLYPAALIISIYRLYNKQTYYVTGTGLSKETGERMWFKTCLHTHSSIVPVKSLEEKMKAQLNFKTCIVISFIRIPNRMAKYIDEEYELDIDYREKF